MKRILILLVMSLFVFSCTSNDTVKTEESKEHKYTYKTEKYYKVVKSTRESSHEETDYHYKYDWWNGKFRQQPDVHTEKEFYITYTDGEIQECSEHDYMFFEKGDTVWLSRQVPVLIKNK
jgi:outer membrane lipoprotein-sorting protein